MPPSCITMHNQKKKTFHQLQILISLLLPSINLEAYLHNDMSNDGMIIHHGSLSAFGQTLQKQLQKNKNNGLPFQLFYINADSSFTEQQTFEIRQLINTSHTIILDGTTCSPETIQATSAAIGGVGLSSPVIMIRGNPKAFPEYKHIVMPAAPPLPEAINRLADESYRLLSTWLPPLYHSRSAGRQHSRWRPEASISIEQRHIDLPCMVGSKFESRQGNEPGWTEGETDACEQAASLSLNYTVDLIRSVPTHIADTQDLKYLRITVDPETNGGAGWHLVNAPIHKHTWFESWTNRETWFGPIADHYTIQVHPLDPDVRLYNAVPANMPKQSHITARSTIQVGVMGQFIFLGPEIVAYQPGVNIEEQEDIDAQPAQDAVNDQASSITDTVSDQSEVPPPSPVEMYFDAPGTSSEQNKEQSKSYYALPKEEAKAYYLKLVDDHFDSYLYTLWKEILEAPNQPVTLNGNNQPLTPSEQIKNQLLVFIMMETMGNITQYNVDKLVSARNYWYIATAPNIYPSIIQAFKDNPKQFKDQRPEFSRPYPFYSFKRKTIIPQTKDTISSNTNNSDQPWLDPSEKPIIQNNRTYRSPVTPVAAFTYSSERSINYKNHEYMLINQSRAGTTDYAAWTWSRDFSNASKHWRTHITCPLWCQDWFFDKNAFSPAAYASFTPGFSSTFAVPASKTDVSTLVLTAAIKPVALGGRIQYRFFYQDYGTWGQSGKNSAFNQVITVNWGSPVFNPEAPVIIKMHNKNLCLNVKEGDTKGNGQVNLYKCRYSESQIWGQDEYHRLKAHTDAHQCLTKNANNIIMLDTCNNASNQKWFWKDQLLRDTDNCYLFTNNNRSLAVTCDPNEATRWRYQVKKPVIKGALTIHPL